MGKYSLSFSQSTYFYIYKISIIKINNDESFDVNDYVLDECCEGRKYRLIYIGE